MEHGRRTLEADGLQGLLLPLAGSSSHQLRRARPRRRQRRRRGWHGPVDWCPQRPALPRWPSLPRRRLARPYSGQNPRRKPQSPAPSSPSSLAFSLSLSLIRGLILPGPMRQRDSLHGRPRPGQRRPGDRAAVGRRLPGSAPRREAHRGGQRVGGGCRLLRWFVCSLPRSRSVRGRRGGP